LVSSGRSLALAADESAPAFSLCTIREDALQLAPLFLSPFTVYLVVVDEDCPVVSCFDSVLQQLRACPDCVVLAVYVYWGALTDRHRRMAEAIADRCAEFFPEVLNFAMLNAENGEGAAALLSCVVPV
jgi:hypothetical protein